MYFKIKFRRHSWNLLPFNVNRWSTDKFTYSSWDTVSCMNFEINKSYILGQPNILSIEYSNPIIAGIGEQVIIKGTGFMNFDTDEPEKTQIRLKNANGIKLEAQDIVDIPLDYEDISIWRDTLINIKIPSIVSSEGSILQRLGVGSGRIRIINQVGKIAESSKDINIEASILNYLDNTNNNLIHKSPPYWARVNCTDKVLFEVNSSISNETIKIIQYAFDEWNKLIGYTFFDFYKRCSEMDTFCNLFTNLFCISLLYHSNRYFYEKETNHKPNSKNSLCNLYTNWKRFI